MTPNGKRNGELLRDAYLTDGISLAEALDYGDSFPVFGPTLRLLTRAALSEGRDRREHHTAEGRWIKTFWRMEQIF
jgi:hypothetical protein